MRFCTSELKTAIIQSWIRRTYKQPVLCVLGIRRDESRSKRSGRGAAPIFKVHRTKNGKAPALPEGSIDWNAIVEVKTEAVFQILRSSPQPLPSAYSFGATRFSCCFCVMGASADQVAATRDPRNHDLYREQCELEISSTFALQANKWLSDVAPELLTATQRVRLAEAKIKAINREAIESRIPSHLLYVQGWPVAMPTLDEAMLIADTRQQVAHIMEIEVQHTTAESVSNRYAEVICLKEAKKRGRKQNPKAAQAQLFTIESSTAHTILCPV